MDYSKIDCIIELSESSSDPETEKSLYAREYELFLKQLRKTRETLGLTQAKLAQRLAQTQSFISKCERGERRLDMIEVRRFCRAMGLSFRDFIDQLESILPTNDSPPPTEKES